MAERTRPARKRACEADSGGAMPRPVSREGAADQIVVDLRSRILSNQIPRGSKLPTERELASSYQVSGPTIREAMRALSALDLVEVRHGSGTFVTASSDRIFANAAGALLKLKNIELIEMLDVLEALFSRGCALACRQATDEDLEDLQCRVEALDVNPLEQNIEGLRAFLHTLARVSHNALIETFCCFFVDVLLDTSEANVGVLRDHWQDVAQKLQVDRRALVEALHARDVDATLRQVAIYHENSRHQLGTLYEAVSRRAASAGSS